MNIWFYKIAENEYGPITEEELIFSIYQTHGELTKNTLVRTSSSDEWQKVLDIKDLLSQVETFTPYTRKNITILKILRSLLFSES